MEWALVTDPADNSGFNTGKGMPRAELPYQKGEGISFPFHIFDPCDGLTF
jgi:hypothetical protein